MQKRIYFTAIPKENFQEFHIYKHVILILSILFSFFIIIKKQLKNADHIDSGEREFALITPLIKEQKQLFLIGEAISTEEKMRYQYILFPLEIRFSDTLPNDSLDLFLFKGTQQKTLQSKFVLEKSVNDSISLYRRTRQ